MSKLVRERWNLSQNESWPTYFGYWLAYPASRAKSERDQFHEVVLNGETLVFSPTATVVSRCRSIKRFYFSWNLSRNGSSKTFHETDHVTRCNACWNLFRSAVAHKFQRVTAAFEVPLWIYRFEKVCFTSENAKLVSWIFKLQVRGRHFVSRQRLVSGPP